MHDLMTLRRLNEEAADLGRRNQQALIQRLERYVQQHGIALQLGSSIESAAAAIARELDRGEEAAAREAVHA